MGAMSDADNTKTDMRRGFIWLFLSLWCFVVRCLIILVLQVILTPCQTNRSNLNTGKAPDPAPW